MWGRAQAGVPLDPSLREKALIGLNPPLYPYAAYVPIERAGQGLPWPAAQHVLSSSATELVVERPDASSLRLRPRGGFLIDPLSKLLWSERRPFHVGERIQQADMIVTVLEVTADRRPLAIEARFEQSLDDPRYVWVQWLETRSEGFTPPPVGGSVTLPGADYVRTVLGVALPFEAKL